MPNRVPATDRGVFINCPFDPEYKEHLNVLLFTVCDGGFSPRIAFESADSGELRYLKILQLIREYRYAIHDNIACGNRPQDQAAAIQHGPGIGDFPGCKDVSVLEA